MGAITGVAAPMFFRLTILLSLLLALAGCQRESYSRSLSGFSSLDKRVLYDFRNDGPDVRAPLDAATTRRVLSAIFPSYLTDTRQCKPPGNADERGQIVPAILASADGSFTGAGVKQTAYLIDVGECGARSPVFATHRLVVFAAGTLAANVEAPRANAIAGTYDLNGDGKNEILLRWREFRQVAHTATLVEFDKDKLAVVEDFGQIYNSDCGAKLPTSASVVYYFPPPAGQKPRFTVELYRADCPAQGQPPQWTRVGGR